MSKADTLNKLLQDGDLKITDLRKDILDIILSAKKPLSAYDILDLLKSKRANAKPPTVYRVIEYFVDKKIIHRVETTNKFVCCSQLDNFKTKYHGILFLCQKCGNSFEVMDDDFLTALKIFSKKHLFAVNESLVEIKGVCEKCGKTEDKQKKIS
jgi:Fur family zinc uptake transcriptional regulator